MNERCSRSRWVNSWALGVGLLMSVACGGRAHDGLGGETGFLETCASDSECQSGLCACGVCTRVCNETQDCDDTRATCSASVNGDTCAVDGRDVCVVADDTTTDPTSGPSDEDASAEACRGPGRYEAGKEGSYQPCCAGLTEVALLSPSQQDDGARTCTEVPLRVYACVEGSCGDGVCEVGENVPCGCADDCPDAQWEQPAPIPPPGDASVPCEGFTCEVPLNSSSAGDLTVQVDFTGPFCSSSCGLHRPTLYHVETGLFVPAGRGLDCNECREFSATGVCETPEIGARSWNGSIHAPDARCTSDLGDELTCQTESQYAPPGRYRAEFCSFSATIVDGSPQCPETGVSHCESVEFDYPTNEPVVIRFDNSVENASDGGSTIDADAGTDSSVE